MTTGWTELGREIDLSAIHWYIGEPVAGDPAPYTLGATEYTDLANHIVNIGTVFDEYTGSDNPQFRGEAARAFNGLADTIREQLALIPGIAEAVAEILSDHQAGLTNLHDEADAALARLRTRWGSYQTASSELRAAEDEIQAQADALLAPTDDSRLLDAQDELAEARTLMLRSRDEAQDLIDEESSLETTTSEALRGLDLGDMANPGFWDELGGALWDVVLTTPIIGDAILLAQAIVAGDLDRVLWRLRDLIDDILFVALVVGLVLAVTFTGGAALALLALAITRLMIDVHLSRNGIEDPDNPGRTIGAKDIAFDALAVVAVGVGSTPSAGTGAGAGARFTQPALPLFTRWTTVLQGTATRPDAIGVVDDTATLTTGSWDRGNAPFDAADRTPELVVRTEILDEAVDAQIAEVASGESPNDVFVLPPPDGGSNLVTTGAEAND